MTAEYVGLEMKQANRNRKDRPGGAGLAEEIRNGATIAEVAARYDMTTKRVSAVLNRAGYSHTGEKAAEAKPPTRTVPTFLFEPQHWTADALCAQYLDPEDDVWHPEGPGPIGGKIRLAKQICRACPVRLACARYGHELDAMTPGQHGIYGGMTPEERKRAREKRGGRK